MKNKIIIFLIVTLAFVLRFWNLGSYPALNADEASIGYDAYSLIQSGRDQHGNSWPIHFQSFNDYKPGGYVYMVLPFVKFFGLNEWSVRIPGAFLSVITVFILYLFIKELNLKEKIRGGSYIELVAPLFLAISPWHIHFSRGGWEVNVATFFILIGVYLFVKYINNNRLYLLLCSLLSFVISLYTYHAARIITPLLGLGLVVIYFKNIFKKENSKSILIALFIAAVLLFPLAKDLTKPEFSSRAAGVGLFADMGPLNRVNEQRGEHTSFSGVTSKLIHNKLVNYSLAFFDNYFKHYHGLFLFLSGEEIQRNKVPETGQMYLLDIVWVVIGLWLIVKNIKNKNIQLILYWLVISPIAAALTFQSPHALRAENMVVPIVVISAIGLSYLLSFFKKFNIFHLMLITLILWQFARYEHMYWIHMAKEYPFSSQYGVKELVKYLNTEIGGRYKNYVITDRYDQPYILTLFYSKYNPVEFQNDHYLTPRDQYGFSTVREFGKYKFVSIHNWDEIRNEYRDSLIAGTDEEIYQGTNIVKEIYGTNGYLYFQVVAN